MSISTSGRYFLNASLAIFNLLGHETWSHGYIYFFVFEGYKIGSLARNGF